MTTTLTPLYMPRGGGAYAAGCRGGETRGAKHKEGLTLSVISEGPFVQFTLNQYTCGDLQPTSANSSP